MVIMEEKQAADAAVKEEEEDNICIIEYNERSLGHAFISKVYYQGGVDISIRFVKQKVKDGSQVYDSAAAPEGIQRKIVRLTALK